MSYCRFGEGSDVYLYTSNGSLNLHGPGADDSRTFSCTEKGLLECLAFMLDLRSQGYEIRERALDRLRAEVKGEPFRTDVQVALDDLHGRQS